MTVDLVSIPLALLGLLTGVYRVVRRRSFSSRNLTVLSFSLGIGLVVRSPWLGDVVLDDAIGRATGWWNVPDVLGHLATFAAMAAALGFFSRALGYHSPLWSSYAVLAVVGIVCVFAYADSPGQHVQSTNMVQLDGMTAYSALFSLALLVTHTFGLFIARQGFRTAGWQLHVVLLFVGTIGGIIMAVHRLVVLAIPEVADLSYDLITWVATLLCIIGYLGAAVVLSLCRRDMTHSTHE